MSETNFRLTKNQIRITILLVFGIVIPTYIFTLSYLGGSFNSDIKIETDDWRRKWIIFFTYINVIIVGLFALFALFMKQNTLLLSLFLPLMSNIIILVYLGTSFGSDTATLDVNDWRRKWIIFFAYIGIISSFFTCFNMASKYGFQALLRKDF